MNEPQNKVLPILRIAGFSVLSALFGVGATWILVAVLAVVLRKKGGQFLIGSMPILLTGGVLGLIIGLAVSIRIARARREVRSEIEIKYFSGGDRLRIYSGAPMFVIAASFPLMERLFQMFGNRNGAYLYLAYMLAIVAVSLFVHDRLPKTFIIPIGVTGWLLTVLLAIGCAIYMNWR